MDQQRCISDAQMFQLGFASYPAIRQNPDADHPQMLQKETALSNANKFIPFTFVQPRQHSPMEIRMRLSAKMVGFGRWLHCRYCSLERKIPEAISEARELCFSTKGTFDYHQH